MGFINSEKNLRNNLIKVIKKGNINVIFDCKNCMISKCDCDCLKHIIEKIEVSPITFIYQMTQYELIDLINCINQVFYLKMDNNLLVVTLLLKNMLQKATCKESEIELSKKIISDILSNRKY